MKNNQNQTKHKSTKAAVTEENAAAPIPDPPAPIYNDVSLFIDFLILFILMISLSLYANQNETEN